MPAWSLAWSTVAPIASASLSGRRPERLAEAAEWIENQRTRWERLFDVVDDYLEEQR